MPKPTTKDQILENAHKERTALEELLSTLTPEQMTQPNMIGEWAAKDVLSHLMEWEQMVMAWYAAGVKGKTPAVPSEEYNWGQLPQLNHAIYLKHRDRKPCRCSKGIQSFLQKGHQNH
ncbi:DinB family protein [Candidatus Villigracilis affinis]|uniref:DinB family protein n=1 Tax=Candidatus Villigracilis affinis TaxID=3140682 RepID=UPI001D798C87|nr:ClbS/DfsB family four-helix bundle protein [Anaerolineales bacterium]